MMTKWLSKNKYKASLLTKKIFNLITIVIHHNWNKKRIQKKVKNQIIKINYQINRRNLILKAIMITQTLAKTINFNNI